MKEIYSEDEIVSFIEPLGFKYLPRLIGYLANFNDLDEWNDKELGEEEFLEKHEQSFIKKLKEVKDKLKLDEDLSKKSTEEKILAVIAITKELCKGLLLKKFEGKIDDKTAERLVEYGYTHGSCNSLVYTLCSLFDECKLKIFSVRRYGHQCVMLNGYCYDITGRSTVEEMKTFVAKEGKGSVEECSVKDLEMQKYKHKLLDQMVLEHIDKVFSLGNIDNASYGV